METKPTLMKYVGPRHALVNSTTNCTLGIWGLENGRDHVFEKCDKYNFYDQSLNKWEVVEENSGEYKYMSRPKVMKTPTESLVYGMYHEIEVFNQTLPCPHYPFRNPLGERYSLPGVEHIVEEVYSQTIQRHAKIQAPRVTGHGGSDEYKREAAAIRAVKEANDRSIPAGGFGINKGTITIPTDWKGILMLILGAKSMIIATICVLKYLNRKGGNKNDEDNEQHDNHISIINNLTPTNVKTEDDITETIPVEHQNQFLSHIRQPGQIGIQNRQALTSTSQIGEVMVEQPTQSPILFNNQGQIPITSSNVRYVLPYGNMVLQPFRPNSQSPS